MKNICLLISFFIISFTAIGQDVFTNDTLVIWNKSRPLNYTDFVTSELKVNQGLPKAKLSFSIIVEPNQFTEEEMFDINILCIVNRKESTFIGKSAWVLNHEQIHFDIGEYYTRKLRKELDILLRNEAEDEQILVKILDLYNRTFEECMKMQTKYDEETNHGKINKKQEEWNLFVKQKLKESDSYYKEYDLSILE